MRVPRLYLPRALETGARLALDGERAHYLSTVLRLRKGAKLVIFNGEGGEYPAVVVESQRTTVQIELGAFVPREVESPLSIHLGLGISRGERTDIAIQKAVELGVTAITPLFTERCVVQLDDARRRQRGHHWRKIAQSACEQCGRNRLPTVHDPMELDAWLERQAGVRLLLHPHDGLGLHELPLPRGGMTLLSGPEGGFTEAERHAALAMGFLPLRLGPRILRSETAALVALAALQATFGDLR